MDHECWNTDAINIDRKRRTATYRRVRNGGTVEQGAGGRSTRRGTSRLTIESERATEIVGGSPRKFSNLKQLVCSTALDGMHPDNRIWVSGGVRSGMGRSTVGRRETEAETEKEKESDRVREEMRRVWRKRVEGEEGETERVSRVCARATRDGSTSSALLACPTRI